MNVQWELFRAAPTLGGWTAGLERSLTSNGVEYTLLERLPYATIYATVTAGYQALNAYIVDDGQPLTISLLAAAPTGSLKSG